MGVQYYMWLYMLLISETVETALTFQSNTSVSNNAADDIFCDGSVYDKIWLRHPTNCSRHFVCSNGQVTELKPCDDGRVFSLKSKTCVTAKSDSDDCDELIFSIPVPAPQSNGQSLLWHPQLSKNPVLRPGAKATSIKVDGKNVTVLQM